MLNLLDSVLNKREKEALQILSKFLVAKDLLFQHYTQIMEPMLIPDLYGKTIRVTKSTFPDIDRRRNLISIYLGLEPPEIFVYENFYYGSDTVGLTKPWIELSAKTINDFTGKEMSFLLARQISHIYLKHFITKVHSEQMMKSFNLLEQTPGLNLINILGTIDAVEKAFQLIFYNWNREINHTADIYGLLFCGDLDSANSAIIKLIINDCDLSQKIDVTEYIKQRNYLTSLTGVVAFYTRLDEPLPYGPIRIAEMIKFLSLSKNKDTFIQMKDIQEELNV
jgi:hypothetical protein